MRDDRRNQDEYDVIQAQAEYNETRPTKPLNETARVALQANLEYYLQSLEDLTRQKRNKEAALEELNAHILKVEGHVQELKEVLDDKRDYSEGVE